MTKKIFSLFVFIMLIVGFTGAQSASAALFPAGCATGLGYSITTGLPCNGTSTATIGFLPGCTTPLGYSTTNGVSCSGTSVVLSYLDGCTSMYGYSTINSSACNGTTTASFAGTPGLPTTGASGQATSNLVLMISASILAVIGGISLARKSRIA